MLVPATVALGWCDFAFGASGGKAGGGPLILAKPVLVRLFSFVKGYRWLNPNDDYVCPSKVLCF